MDINNPLISVIMPCYNSGHIIGKTVESLYQQTCNDFELIIINDGSTDNSLSIAQQLAQKHPNLIIINQNNRGPGPARNQGLKAAKGRLIAFLDADDSWEPECLSKLYQGLLDEPEAILAYCGWQNTGLTANRCKPYIPPDYEQNDKLATLLRTCPWPIHAVLTYKSAIEKVNGFNEHWLTSEDFDMWFRIAAFGKIVRVPEVLAYYNHRQGEQISANRLRAILNHWGVQKSLLRDFPEIIQSLGSAKVDAVTDGELLNRAYENYWHGDLLTAHSLFRKVLLLRYYQFTDLKYIALSILPFFIFRFLIKILRKTYAE